MCPPSRTGSHRHVPQHRQASRHRSALRGANLARGAWLGHFGAAPPPAPQVPGSPPTQRCPTGSAPGRRATQVPRPRAGGRCSEPVRDGSPSREAATAARASGPLPGHSLGSPGLAPGCLGGAEGPSNAHAPLLTQRAPVTGVGTAGRAGTQQHLSAQGRRGTNAFCCEPRLVTKNEALRRLWAFCSWSPGQTRPRPPFPPPPGSCREESA